MTPSPPHGPLHFLADVAIRTMPCPARNYTSQTDSAAGPSNRYSVSSPTVASLHISCGKDASGLSSPEPIPLKRSNSSNRFDTETRSSIRRKKNHKASSHSPKARLQLKNRRKELMEKAMKIRSLDNSPVNSRQFIVLRMVYDEITMYPSESWMVLMAIIIRRAFKQVKNWFSNERQKHRSGKVIPVETDDGDKVRLRPLAIQGCQEWSDKFFEEVVMIHNYKVLRNSRQDDTLMDFPHGQ
ncbi:hypothetical protein K443DRAFT_673378 [Laccaria amethystina LaAM-08-1]|jgi:hypothetical protein|uniref:Homeobox domain-containing protein n=1 Tax=Laccaria amethystina LaAM-08-1 TaxID=1095629 RepID=A0A0C9Y0Q2_9AGAR|nr:hypothetical protein K443DRAFT_673378 [Laccaria amethystina LaAM-08-1]